MKRLVRALAEGQQSAFSASDLASVAAAAAALDAPLEAREAWAAAPGRGLFFVFEGLDRSGKSTQSRRLAKHLEQMGRVRWMCFPDRHTAVGTLIDLYLRRKIELQDETVHRLFSANRWETARSIVETLNSGTSVVCDRYAFSGVAYSAAKGLDAGWCREPDRGLPCPDKVFFMHIDEKVGAGRAAFGDERYENAEMQAAVRRQFQEPALRAAVAWQDVDGARDMDAIHEEIRAAADAVAAEAPAAGAARPIQRLWAA